MMSAHHKLSLAYRLLLILLIVFLLAKLAYLFKPHEVGWDEAVYIGMGKYLYSAGTAGLWEDIRPPGLPVLLGALWVLFPHIIITLSELLAVLFALGAGVLTFLIGKKISNEHVGAISTFLLLSAPVFFSSSSSIMSAIPATFFSLLALYLYLSRQHFFAIGISAGAAFLFRFPQGIALVAVFALLLLSQTTFQSKLRNILFFFCGFLLIVLPFLGFNYAFYSGVTASPADALFRPIIFASSHQYNPFHPESTFFYFGQLLRQNALFSFALVGFAFFLRRRMLPLTLFAVLYLLYYTFIPNKQTRFLIDFLPYLSILSGAGLFHAYTFFRGARRFSIAALVGLFLLVAATLIPVMSHNYLDYAHRTSSESPLIPFFSKIELLGGPFLTMTPLPAAYSDALFIPMYDNPSVALQTYATFRDQAHYVIYFSDYYPCFSGDPVCLGQQEELYNELGRHPRIKELRINGQEYIILRSLSYIP